jgi:hypothetical protein
VRSIKPADKRTRRRDLVLGALDPRRALSRFPLSQGRLGTRKSEVATRRKVPRASTKGSQICIEVRLKDDKRPSPDGSKTDGAKSEFGSPIRDDFRKC